MKYNYRTGNVERPTSHFGSKVVYMTAGLVIGAYMGAVWCVGQIQAGVQPIVTYDTDSSLEIGSTLASPENLQPAANVQWVQGGEDNMNWVLQ